MNILISGGSGFIGRNLIDSFLKKNIKITVLTRNKNKFNNSRLNIIEKLEEVQKNSVFDAIINLAGAPIERRWSESYKEKLIMSRINTTESIYKLVSRLEVKPRILISASAIGYYGRHGDEPIDENSKPSEEFTHQLCKKWEKAALKVEDFDTRVCIIRLGVVLGENGGVLKKTLPLFKMGLGAKIGSGKQYFSWVHIEDVVSAIHFLFHGKNTRGIYNLTSPNPVTNLEWTQVLASTIKRSAILPLPHILVKFLFGEMGEKLLLNGQKVLPTNLTNAGYKFKYAMIKDALHNILIKKSGAFHCR